MSELVVSGTVITDGMVLTDSWVAVDQGVISAIGDGPAPPSEQRVEAAVISPGFLDLHCHGGGGASVDDGVESIITARAYHLRHGTAGAMISLVTAAPEELARRAGQVRQAASFDHRVLGVHFEGPSLAAEKRGAHDPNLLRAPSQELLEILQDAAGDLPTMITLAPELPGAIGAIEQLTSHGWLVALGHTDATYETGVRAIEAGARVITHAFNGMRGLDHRLPGVLPAAFFDQQVIMEVIADGEHVHPQMIRLLFASAPDRVALVTDAMAAAGQPDGQWTMGGLEIDVIDGLPRLREGGSIAGSTLTQDRAIRVAVAAGVPLAAAVDAATTVPARLLGLSATHGSLRAGRRADLVLLDDELQVEAVYAAGILFT